MHNVHIARMPLTTEVTAHTTFAKMHAPHKNKIACMHGVAMPTRKCTNV